MTNAPSTLGSYKKWDILDA